MLLILEVLVHYCVFLVLLEQRTTFDFTEESLKTYGSDIDNGQVSAAVGSSAEYGQITTIATDGETDNGDILPGEGTPFGYSTSKDSRLPVTDLIHIKVLVHFSLSGGVDQLEEPFGASNFILLVVMSQQDNLLEMMSLD